MGLSLTPAGGRYPYNLARYEARNIRAHLEREGDRVRIRIDDVENIDAWQELTIDVRLLLGELLQGSDAEQEKLPSETTT